MEKILGYYKFINEKESSKEKVLFISFKDKTRGVSYHKYLNSKLNCTFSTWEDLIFLENKILIGNKNVKDFDFVFIQDKNPSYLSKKLCSNSEENPPTYEEALSTNI